MKELFVFIAKLGIVPKTYNHSFFVEIDVLISTRGGEEWGLILHS